MIKQKNKGMCSDDGGSRKFKCICTPQYLGDDVKLIVVIFINAKIMEHVLSLLSTTFQHQNVNVPEIMVVQRVTSTYA